MSKLTMQDVIDAKEIEQLEEIAEMRAGRKTERLAEVEQTDDDLESPFNTKELSDEKPYLQMEQLEAGDLRICLFIPPYNINDLKEGYKEKLTMYFSQKKLEQMRKKFAGHNSIVCYIDGACS